MRSNNWYLKALPKSGLDDLISSLQSPDCEEIFKCSTLYYGKRGTAVLHLNTTIRVNRIRKVMSLDWENAQGSIKAIVADLEATESPIEKFQFPLMDKMSVNVSETSLSKVDSSGRQEAFIPEPEVGSLSSPVVMDSRQKRLEKALLSENEEKKRITQELFKVYRALSGGAVPAVINPDACRLIADRLIEENNVHEELNRRYIANLKQQIAELETKNQMLERAYHALDQLSREQGMKARQLRRVKVIRKSQHGWDKSASTWVDPSSR